MAPSYALGAQKYIEHDTPDIAILGGGVTGLAAAYYCSRQLPRAKITLFEQGARCGGWMQSSRVKVPGGQVLFEQGPHSLRATGSQANLLAVNLVSPPSPWAFR